MITTVLWDFGGVILSSPFEAFHTLEADRGIPKGTIRGVIASDAGDHLWGQMERSEIAAPDFSSRFGALMAKAGHSLTGLDVLGVLHGTVRPEMVQVLDRVIELGYKTACLTNNFNRPTEHAIESDHEREVAAIMARFDLVVESRVVGFRKPEPKFYNYACEQLGVKPSECVFLDDIGSNLKPAAAMGMSTIKVLSADQAISDLEKVLSKKLRSR